MLRAADLLEGIVPMPTGTKLRSQISPYDIEGEAWLISHQRTDDAFELEFYAGKSLSPSTPNFQVDLQVSAESESLEIGLHRSSEPGQRKVLFIDQNQIEWGS